MMLFKIVKNLRKFSNLNKLNKNSKENQKMEYLIKKEENSIFT